MASSTIKRSKEVLSQTFSFNDFTIAGAGYFSLGQVLPGRELLSATIGTWTSNTGAVSIAIATANTLYAIGTPGAVIKGLNVKVCFR